MVPAGSGTGLDRSPSRVIEGTARMDGWRWDMTGIWAGADPGGIGAFGVAVVD